MLQEISRNFQKFPEQSPEQSQNKVKNEYFSMQDSKQMFKKQIRSAGPLGATRLVESKLSACRLEIWCASSAVAGELVAAIHVVLQSCSLGDWWLVIFHFGRLAISCCKLSAICLVISRQSSGVRPSGLQVFKFKSPFFVRFVSPTRRLQAE